MNKNCKYPVIMNEHRKKFLKTLRNYHRGFTILILLSVFAPRKYLSYSVILLLLTAISNYVFTGNITRCCIQHFEWISSNCENYTIIDSFLEKIKIDKKYTKLFTTIVYSSIFLIMVLRLLIT